MEALNLQYIKLNRQGMEEILLEYYHFDYSKRTGFETIEVNLRKEKGGVILYVKAFLQVDLQEDKDNFDFSGMDFNKTLKLITKDRNVFYGKFCERQIKKLFRRKYYFEKNSRRKRVFLFCQNGEICLVCLKGFGRIPGNFEDLEFTDTYQKI